MKCPKCGYLGFETTERCRNCGYDFSLSVESADAAELPLHSPQGVGGPLADFDLADHDPSTAHDSAPALDLDRMIGEAEPVAVSKTPALPFGGEDDAPLITAPRPARPPLSVRRTTPEIPRTRSRSVTPRFDEGELEFANESGLEEPAASAAGVAPASAIITQLVDAPASRRVIAAAIDLTMLAAINLAVVYLTLALAGLAVDQIAVLPLAPLVGFFAILDGGYLVAFIAASGQTIGKMVTGIRVVRDDGSRVDIAGAVLRAVGCGVSLATLGLGYLPAFVSADRRALQDRLSRTRVVSAG